MKSQAMLFESGCTPSRTQGITTASAIRDKLRDNLVPVEKTSNCKGL